MIVPLAILRSSDWEWALLFHVLGAFLVVGAIATVVALAVAAERSPAVEEAAALRTWTLRTVLFAVLPSYLLMRVAAEWVRSEDPFPDDLTWLSVGYIVTDAGVPLLIALAVLAWLGARKTRRDRTLRPLTARIALGIATVYLVALVVAAWAMTTKPT